MPDTDLAVFSMHGMGANDSDVPTMALLPELMYRFSFGSELFERRADWAVDPDAIPMLRPEERWASSIRACLRHPSGSPDIAEKLPLDWMPATVYRRYWPAMQAFALPSYYDGRIRLNLVGRERDGRVALSDYHAKLDEISALIQACRDPRTNEPVARTITRPAAADPLGAGPTETDLVVVWRGAALAFRHDRFGLIGPMPFRRTGGHSGGHGMGYFVSPRLTRGDIGTASSFDVVPTLIDLLGTPAPGYVSGRSLLKNRADAPAA